MSRKDKWEQGSFRDQWDNERMRSLDRGDRTGTPSSVPIDDDYHPLDADYFPAHGEAFDRRREIPPRDQDLGFDEMGTSWNEGVHYGGRDELHWNNLTRSDLRPDLHPEQDHYGKGPRGYLKSDEALKEDVCMALHRSREVDASDVEVSVEDRCVYLKGSIASRGMRNIAEDLVGSVPGVIDVFTHLKIKEKS